MGNTAGTWAFLSTFRPFTYFTILFRYKYTLCASKNDNSCFCSFAFVIAEFSKSIVLGETSFFHFFLPRHMLHNCVSFFIQYKRLAKAEGGEGFFDASAPDDTHKGGRSKLVTKPRARLSPPHAGSRH
jgi:hypothetical protein